MSDIKNKSVNMAFSAICTAVSIVMLYIASVLPTARLTLCAIVSATVCLTMIKSGVKSAFALYLAVTLLSAIILPDKAISIAYGMVFGIYPIIKAFIEKRNNLILEWLLKIIVFIIYSVLFLFGAGALFPGLISTEVTKPILLTGVIVVLALYDVALSLIIAEASRRFSKILN